MEEFEEILRCCDSITRTALTYRTLSAPVPRFGNLNEQLILEKDLAEWLDQRIFDYRVKLKALASNSETLQDDTTQQQSLLDETKRQQQELLLLKFLANSKAVEQAHSNEGDPLIRDCLGLHSDLGKQVEQLFQQFHDLRTIAKEKLEKFRQIEQDNQQLWEEIKSRKQEKIADSTESKLKKENRVLKLIISDLLSGSNIDWYEDPRLLQLLSTVEGPDC